MSTSSLRIVLGGAFLASYPEGGGHWMVFLQYLLGLRALGHDAWWLEVMRSTGDADRDGTLVRRFFDRMAAWGLDGRAVLLVAPKEPVPVTLETTTAYGAARAEIEALARDADLLWNFSCALRPPLLELFSRRALIDLDPGHLQASALDWDLGLQAHHVFLTVGANVGAPECGVPTLGVTWHAFTPVVHLPSWRAAADPGPSAPFTSVTQWTWEHVRVGDRTVSVSKRDGYLRYVDVRRRAARPFELAANIGGCDPEGDRSRLEEHGWRVVDPHEVAASPEAYRDYLAASRAEFACPKPIHRELRTGWFSDRSACYLASGRPVVTEDTGFGVSLPTGRGLLTFRDVDEAVACVCEVDRDWARHHRAAREIAEEHLGAARSLRAMLASCGR